MSQEKINAAMSWFLQIEGIVAAAVADNSGTILYTTDNWDISGDFQNIKRAWGGAQAVTAMNTKFSVLQREDMRFVATNFGGAGHLVAVKTQEEPAHYVFAFLSKEADARSLVMEAQRAIDMIFGAAAPGGGDFGGVGDGAAMGGGYGGAATAAPGIDPTVKANVDTFLSWIKDPNGFPAYIKYYLDMNDSTKIYQLAGIYDKFKRVFGF
jgi:hypothetical protein